MNLLIVDDEWYAVKGLSEGVDWADSGIGQVFTAFSVPAAKELVQSNEVNVVLLDIEMPGCTGMEMAEQIRPHLPQGKIIFITSHVEYAIDAFALSIFRYVPKAELAQRLPAALRDAIALITLEDGKTYTIQTSSRLEKLPYREIYFIERDGKNARITTASGVSKVRKSLQQVYEELGAEEFLYIDRGCIVNLIHVMQIKDGMAVLKNGVTLPISRSHLQAVKAEINRYWGEHI